MPGSRYWCHASGMSSRPLDSRVGTRILEKMWREQGVASASLRGAVEEGGEGEAGQASPRPPSPLLPWSSLRRGPCVLPVSSL